jgi:ABC-type phosphate transport system substrate-binding protein
MKTLTKTMAPKIAIGAVLAFAAVAAHAELVVIVNAKNAAASMSKDQVANVYLGKDTSFAPVDLPESSAERDEFYKKVADKDAAQVKAIWSRLVFSGTAQPPKAAANDAEAVKQVAGNDKAIGYVEKSAVTPAVKVVMTVN